MSIFAEKDGKKLIPRSIYLKILVFCCLIGISAIALQPIQAALGSAMTEIRDNFIVDLENKIGMDIRYASIRPAFFGSFEIRNLRFYKDGRSFFSLSRASIRFSLPKLITGNKTAFHTVYLERPVLRMDLQRDLDLFEMFSSQEIQEIQNNKETEKIIIQQIAEFLPKKMNYKISDGSLLFVGGSFVYQFDGINISIQGEKGVVLFDSSFDAEIRYSGFKDKTIVFHTNIDIKSIGDDGLQEFKADILLSSISCSEQRLVKGAASFFRPVSTMERTSLIPLFTIRPINIVLSYSDRVINIEQLPGSQNINYSYIYDFKSGYTAAQLILDNHTLGSSISFTEDLIKANHLLDIAVSGIFWFTKNENGAVSYIVNYNGGNDTDSFNINLYGTENNFFINKFNINASEKTVNAGLIQGSVNAGGKAELAPFRPELNISFNNFTMTGKEGIIAEIDITSSEEEINVLGQHLLIGNIGVEELSINISPNENDILFLASLICQNEGEAFIDAVFSRSPGQFDAILNLDSFSLYNLAGIFRPFIDFLSFPEFANGFFKKNKLDTEVYFSYNFNNFIYNATNIVLKNETILGEMSISGTDKQFNLSHGVFYFGKEVFLINADAIINNPMDLNFNINANFQDVAWNAEGQILDGTTLIIRDPNGFHAYGNASHLGAVSGYIEGIDYPLPINENLVYLNFYITLRYNSKDFWSLDVSYFEAHDINSLNDESILKISGSADQDGASFREIVINDSIGMLFGHADFAWDSDFSYLQFYSSMTDGYEDGEFYNFEGMLKNKNININSTISNMHINRFIRGSNTMLASAEANIVWDSINSFSADVNISKFYASIKENNINGSGNISITNDIILAKDLSVEYKEIKAVLPILQISRTEGFAVLKTDIKGLILKKDFEIQAGLNADFSNMNSWIDAAQVLNNFKGDVYFEKFHYGDVLYDNVEFALSGENGNISILGGVDEMFRLEMDPEGNFYMGLSAPLPIRGAIAGTLNKKLIIDAHCNYFFIDIGSLHSLASAKDSDVLVSEGFITGKIDVRGSIFNPEFFGMGKGSSFNIQVPNFIAQDIRPVPFNVIAEGYEMVFGPAVTICGTGGGIANGWFRFENWSPKNIGLEIEVSRETPIPYNLNIAGFSADGDASGMIDLLYYAADSLVELRADIFMNNTEMLINMGDFSSNMGIFNGGENHTIIDLRVTTGSMVEFFWPNKNNPIIRVNPEMGTVFYLTSDTQAQQYTIDSVINIKSGELSYLDRNFFIRQGELVLKENEREFNPYLTARAEIRDRIDSGSVTISMIVENQPLLSFVPRFESNPGLTQLELYSLLGQNYNIQDSDDPDSVQRFLMSSTTDLLTQVIARSDAFGQVIFLKQFERQVRNFLNLDMLSIRTKVFQNAVVSGMANLGMAGSASIDRNTNVGNYFDNTTVSIGKYIGPDMFVQGTLAMKYDENSSFMGGIKLEPDIGIEWQTPFANIRWNFFPTNPQNWFVTDNSITLSWSKTF